MNMSINPWRDAGQFGLKAAKIMIKFWDSTCVIMCHHLLSALLGAVGALHTVSNVLCVP